MFKSSTRHLLCITLLFLSLAPPINGHPSGKDEVEMALAALGGGSADEMRGRLITDLITVHDDEDRIQAVAALPTLTRGNRITRGRLFRRVETIWSQVLRLHGRGGTVELFLFQDERPSARVLRGCVLALSDGLAELLYDGELAGIFAHELGHSYFADEMEAARSGRDDRAMRVVELKCDAVALLSLKLLGHDPALYLRGLRRIEVISKRKGQSSGILPTHPELVERTQFSQRFIKSLS